MHQPHGPSHQKQVRAYNRAWSAEAWCLVEDPHARRIVLNGWSHNRTLASLGFRMWRSARLGRAERNIDQYQTKSAVIVKSHRVNPKYSFSGDPRMESLHQFCRGVSASAWYDLANLGKSFHLQVYKLIPVKTAVIIQRYFLYRALHTVYSVANAWILTYLHETQCRGDGPLKGNYGGSRRVAIDNFLLDLSTMYFRKPHKALLFISCCLHAKQQSLLSSQCPK